MEWALTLSSVLQRRGKFGPGDTGRHRGRWRCDDTGRDGVMLYEPTDAGDCGLHQKLEKGLERRSQPSGHRDFRLVASRAGRGYVSVLPPPRVCCLVTVAPCREDSQLHPRPASRANQPRGGPLRTW